MRRMIYRLAAASATKRARLWQEAAATLPPGDDQDWCVRKAGLALALAGVYRDRCGRKTAR